MGTIASQITSITIFTQPFVQTQIRRRKHQSSTSLAFVRGIHRGPVNSPQKWPVTRKMFPFDDVIMVHVPMKWATIGSGNGLSFYWTINYFNVNEQLRNKRQWHWNPNTTINICQAESVKMSFANLQPFTSSGVCLKQREVCICNIYELNQLI